ncbi:IS200/IS605 family transposase [Dyadobacter arcticus]|uniref:REP element-mobilizing transposase RayT n=1 Tax=Dyadobacter arcticus TaxID=1078754 RepID=A0ABX0UPU1_9BACT|nr:IS200/IS605 family transposase [Dyadobacter arcticus]NIJ55013.1 REP element-mobilizing transposase RayT [Dyadobacter arcticus]
MANTYHQMYAQTVFAVKYREARIQIDWKADLLAVIGNLINETGASTIIVNGVEDHVHCFFSMKPSQCVSDIMKSAKAKSSKWINESGLLKRRFEWQIGYGSFTYNKTDIHRVFKYIENQEAHHKKQSFRAEYIEMLVQHGIEFEHRHLFEDLR